MDSHRAPLRGPPSPRCSYSLSALSVCCPAPPCTSKSSDNKLLAWAPRAKLPSAHTRNVGTYETNKSTELRARILSPRIVYSIRHHTLTPPRRCHRKCVPIGKSATPARSRVRNTTATPNATHAKSRSTPFSPRFLRQSIVAGKRIARASPAYPTEIR